MAGVSYGSGGDGSALGRGSAVAQLFALLCDITSTFCSSLVRSLLLAIRLLSQRATNARASDGGGDRAGEVEFYEGKVWHERRRPVLHRFEYDVRYALVHLDSPPLWFAESHHMAASEARSIAATAGPVLLLTTPTSMGYEQNPLSVYYCYDEQDSSLLFDVVSVDSKTGDEHPLGRTSYISVCPWIGLCSEASAYQSFHGYEGSVADAGCLTWSRPAVVNWCPASRVWELFSSNFES